MLTENAGGEIHFQFRLTLAALLAGVTLLIVGCGQSPPPNFDGEERHFTGTWSFTGSQQLLQLAAGEQAGIFHVEGSLLLAGPERPAIGYRAEVIGFSHTQAGMVGRSVWVDRRGDEIFSELKGASALPGNRLSGRLTGGTGRYAGVTGEYTFTWQRVAEYEDSVSGRVSDLVGWLRLAKPTPTTEAKP
jgi:hypothetical protein